ncbi:MAG: hypothetical protein Q4P66_06645 [Actinomycetaceae bacterium]|nr:hypothetical protein [Actinomycetaceae bacterium]
MPDGLLTRFMMRDLVMAMPVYKPDDPLLRIGLRIGLIGHRNVYSVGGAAARN